MFRRSVFTRLIGLERMQSQVTVAPFAPRFNSNRYKAFDADFDQESLVEARTWYESFHESLLPKGNTTYSRSSGPGGQHVNKYGCIILSGFQHWQRKGLKLRQPRHIQCSNCTQCYPNYYILMSANPSTIHQQMIPWLFKLKIPGHGMQMRKTTEGSWRRSSYVSTKRQCLPKQAQRRRRNTKRCKLQSIVYF